MYKNSYEFIKNEIKNTIPKKINNQYVSKRDLWSGGGESNFALCGQDLSQFDLSELDKNYFKCLSFDTNTKFSKELKEKFEIDKLLETGKEFGLQLNVLHKAGIDGKGINVAVIDTNFDAMNCMELNDELGETRVKLYNNEEILEERKNFEMFHGKTVTTLLGGNNVGVAPKANIYFFATNFEQNQQIAILEKIKMLNRRGYNINVISISSQIKDLELNEQYTTEFRDNNCALINSNNFLKNGYLYFNRNNYEDINNPQNFEIQVTKEEWENFAKGLRNPALEEVLLGVDFEDKLFIPCGGRTYPQIGNNGYMYCGISSASWTIPQVAGLFALAKQLNPLLTFDEFTQISRETCHRNEQGYRVVNPPGIARQINEINKEKAETDERYKDIYSESQKLIDALDEVMRNQEVDTQKLGQETMQEQNDTQYINETKQEMEELEKEKGIEELELE